MTARTDLTMQEMGMEFDAWKLHEFGPNLVTFYSGPMDPLVRWCIQEGDKLRAQVEAVDGRQAKKTLDAPAKQTA